MSAPVSMCLIVRDEPLLGEALASVRPWVEELIVVVTCSSDKASIETARACKADRVEVFEGCNDVPGPEGLMVDFAAARNFSFSLATQPWTAWMDADDLIEGLEHLPHVLALGTLAKAAGVEPALQFHYEYAHDDAGRCVCLQVRERIFSSRTAFRWMNRCHEVCPGVAPNAVVQPVMSEIVWKHQRHRSARPAPWAPNTPYPDAYFVHHDNRRFRSRRAHTSGTTPPTGMGNDDWEFYRREDPNRNVRIMRIAHAEHPEDARTLYYFGCALTDAGLTDESVPILSKYVDKSGWDEERALACLKLSNILFFRAVAAPSAAAFHEAARWASRAVMERENWGEGYLQLARICSVMAKQGIDSQRNWERCVRFGKLGLDLPPTTTAIYTNPLERDYDAHELMNVARSMVGDTRGALEAAEAALKVNPDNAHLKMNRLIFRENLARTEAVEALRKFKGVSAEIVRDFNHRRATPETFDRIEWSINDPLAFETEREAAKAQTNGVAHVAEIPPNRLDIVFACGDCWEDWNPKTAAETGIGGSETAVLEMAKRFAAKGHRVRVYTSCGEPNRYDGVEYKKTADLYSVGRCDVLVCWRYAQYVDACAAPVKLLWVHDVWAMGATPENLPKFDRILALSQWHRQFLLQHPTMHGISPKQLFVTRNGLDLTRFEQQVTRDVHKCVYSSSADRGLEELLAMWPEIWFQEQKASLDIFYGTYNWEKMARQGNDAPALARIDTIKARIKVLEPMGVRSHGRVNQRELAKAYLGAGVWAFSTWFSETFCIGAAEATAAGLAMVTSPIAALNETVGERGVLIPGDSKSKEYAHAFAQAVVRAMRETTDEKRKELQQYARENLSWDGVVLQWEALFVELLLRWASHAVPTKVSLPAAPMSAMGVVAPPRDPNAYEGVL